MDQTTVERLRAHDWGADPFEATPSADQPYRIRLVEGRCFFLDREHRCRIHSEVSYESKPAVCRAFPLAVLDVGGQRYARLSFWCPTVTANRGKPVAHQARWISETARHTDRRTAPLRINETTELTPRDVERVHRALCRFLLDTARPVGDRLTAAAGLVRRLDAAAATDGSTAMVDRVLRAAESEGAAALARETRGQGHRSGGRRVLSLYLLQDRQAGRAAVLARFLSVVAFNLGVARLRSLAVPSRASWREVRKVTFAPSEASDALLTRYLSAKLDSRRYMAGDATLVTGFNVLVAAYGMINLLARMRAATHRRRSTDDTDVQLAVSAADLLVVEHRDPDRGRVRTGLSRATLGTPTLCADLLAYLDGRG